MKRLADFLIGLVIGIVLLYFLVPKSVPVDDILKAKDRELKHRIDSTAKIIESYRKKEIILHNAVKSSREAKSKAEQETIALRRRLADIKDFEPPVTAESHEIIQVVRYRVERLMSDSVKLVALIAYTGGLETELSVANALISDLDSLAGNRFEIIKAQAVQLTDWKDRFSNQEEITKQERRQKRRWRAVAYVAIGVVGYLSFRE